MERITRISFLGLFIAVCLFQPSADAKMINEENACTWGISNDALAIPADSLITNASLTLYNVCTVGNNPQALYIQLLDNPGEGVEEIADAQTGNFFDGFGTFLKKIDASGLSATPKTITISLGQINDTQAWVWDIYDAPVIVTLGDSTTTQMSSSQLSLLDYAGTGASFGFGLDCDGVSFDGLSLQLTVRSTTAATAGTVLNFQTGSTTITNTAPVFTSIANQKITASNTLACGIAAVDADGDAVTITASNLPQGAVFNGGTFSWTPSTGQVGIYTVTFTANDGNGGIASMPLQITVTALSTSPSQWTTLAYDDFESGWGHYTDGGADCYLYTRTKYAPQGTSAADIQSGSGDASSFVLTNGIDVKTPGYSQIEITFSYIPVSMDNTSEGFRLDYWNGAKWITLKSWYSFVDFTNFNTYTETVNISKSSVAFPTNMKIRFVCEASNYLDDVMIDEISIAAR